MSEFEFYLFEESVKFKNKNIIKRTDLIKNNLISTKMIYLLFAKFNITFLTIILLFVS